MKRLLQVLVAVTMLALLTGCGPTFNSLPLPGESVRGDTVTFTADFDEALNLADGAVIKVNGVNAGRVQDVAVHDFRARITLEVQESAGLRQGATARLRYTTPLGELFVDVANPASGEALADGDHLDTADTSTAPTVEDALSASSLLVNGGGLNHLKVITDEANILLRGREGTFRSLLDRSEYFVSEFNAGKGDIDAALTAMDGVARVLHERRDVINRALREVRPAAAVVQANLDEITTLLTRLEAFGATANAVVIETRDQVLSLIRQVGPVLVELANTRAVLPETLNAIIRVAGGLDKVFSNDWFQLGSHAYLISFLMGGGAPGLPALPLPTEGGAADVPDAPGLPGLSSLPGLDSLSGLLGGGATGPSAREPKQAPANEAPLGGLLGDLTGLFGGGR